MLRPRVIPVLLLSESGFVKTKRFKERRYIGDPINSLRIFNDKEVDEIVILNIEATIKNQGPDFAQVGELASECFMPLAYGGGIRSAADVERLFSAGVEKVILGTAAAERPCFVREVSSVFGAQSVVVCLDIRRNWRGKPLVYTRCGSKDTGRDAVDFALELQDLGAGEIILQSIDRDGTGRGYDLDLIRDIAAKLTIPFVACGGAGSIDDLKSVIGFGAAAAAGSFFVYYGKHQAVLISYLENHEILNLR
jgi:cyclase